MNDKLATRLKENAVRAGYRDALELIRAEARECVYFLETAAHGAKIGASKIGGAPDLPEDIPWPKLNDGDEDIPGIFLAQIDLSDVPPIDILPLGREGHMWFFVSSGPSANPSVKVVHVPKRVKLRRNEPTNRPAYRKTAVPIRFERGLALPLSRTSFLSEIDKLSDGKGDWTKLGLGSEGSEGSLGGYGEPLEFDLQREIAYEQLGKPEAFWDDRWQSIPDFERHLRNPPCLFGKTLIPSAAKRKRTIAHIRWKTEHRAELDAEASKWTVLASFRSNMNTLFDFGDAVALDIFARSSDLAQCDFSRLVGKAPMVL